MIRGRKKKFWDSPSGQNSYTRFRPTKPGPCANGVFQNSPRQILYSPVYQQIPFLSVPNHYPFRDRDGSLLIMRFQKENNAISHYSTIIQYTTI